MKLPTHPMFTYTLDLAGVHPTQPMLCFRCKTIDNKEEVMIYRLSKLARSPELINWVIDIFFKCPRCGLVCGHGLPTTKEHFLHVYKLRVSKGIQEPRRYVPKDTWSKSLNKVALERLEALGYF